MEGITVKLLKEMCEDAIKKGCGNKTILISCDDEGNGFHTLFFGFMTDINDINVYKDLFHDNNNPKNVVLLG